MNPRGSPRTGYLLLGATVIGWGLNWPLIRVLLHDWPPLLARGSASLMAGLSLAVLAASRGRSLAVARTEWLRLAAAALVNVTAWMGAATVALLWLTVAEGALVVYTMPVWAMLFAWLLRGERPTWRGLLGLALSFAGLVVLFAGKGLAVGADKAPGIALMLGAAILFAYGAVAMRAPGGLASLTFAAWQVGLGSLPMLAGAALFERAAMGPLSPEGLGALAYMTAVPMALCYVTWFGALERLPAAAATSATLLVPVVGIVSAAVFLGEPFGSRELASLLLVLVGVALSLRRP